MMMKFFSSVVVALLALPLLEAFDGEPLLYKKNTTEVPQSVNEFVTRAHLASSSATSAMLGVTASRTLQASFRCSNPSSFVTAVHGDAEGTLYRLRTFDCSDGTSVTMNIGIYASGTTEYEFDQYSKVLGFCGLFIGAAASTSRSASCLKLIVCDGSTPNTWGTFCYNQKLYNCPNGQIMVGLTGSIYAAVGTVLAGSVSPICNTLKFRCTSSSAFITGAKVWSGAGLDGIDSFTCSDGTTVSMKIGGTGGSAHEVTTTAAFCGFNVGTWEQYSIAAAGLSFRICGGDSTAVYGDDYLNLSTFDCSSGVLVGLQAGTTRSDGRFFVAQGSMAPICGNLPTDFQSSSFRCADSSAFITSVNLNSGAALDGLQSFACSDGTSVNMNLGGNGGGSSTPIDYSGFCGLEVGRGTTFLNNAASGLSFNSCDASTTQVYGVDYADRRSTSCPDGQMMVGMTGATTPHSSPDYVAQGSVAPICATLSPPRSFRCAGFSAYITSVNLNSGAALDGLQRFTCSDGTSVNMNLGGNDGGSSAPINGAGFCGLNVGNGTTFLSYAASGLSFIGCDASTTQVYGVDYTGLGSTNCPSWQMMVGMTGSSIVLGGHGFVRAQSVAPICATLSLPSSFRCASPSAFITSIKLLSSNALFKLESFTCSDASSVDMNVGNEGGLGPFVPIATSGFCGLNVGTSIGNSDLAAGLSFISCDGSTTQVYGDQYTGVGSTACSSGQIMVGMTCAASDSSGGLVNPGSVTPICATLSFQCSSSNAFITSVNLNSGAALDGLQSFTCSDGTLINMNVGGNGGGSSTPIDYSGFCGLNVGRGTTFLSNAVSGLSFIGCDGTTTEVYGVDYVPVTTLNCPTGQRLVGLQAGSTFFESSFLVAQGSISLICATITATSANPATPLPTTNPTPQPTVSPTTNPTPLPSTNPTPQPTVSPTTNPMPLPTTDPTRPPTTAPTMNPTPLPTTNPSRPPTTSPTTYPTPLPTTNPTRPPTNPPTPSPTTTPTSPTNPPTTPPTTNPTMTPTSSPTTNPTPLPTTNPTKPPTTVPTRNPTSPPTLPRTNSPTATPTKPPTPLPTKDPPRPPTAPLTPLPTKNPTRWPYDWRLTKLGSNAKKVSVGKDGILGMIDRNSNIWISNMGRYWTQLPGASYDIAVIEKNRFFVIGVDYKIYRWNGRNGWNVIGNDVKSISASADGTIAAVNSQTGQIWYKNGYNDYLGWVAVPYVSGATRVAVVKNGWLYYIGSDGTIYYSDMVRKPVRVGHSGLELAAAADGSLVTANSWYDIWSHYGGKNVETWFQIPGKAYAITVLNSKSVVAVGADGTITKYDYMKY